MTKLEKIEQQIATLTPEELRRLTKWLREFRARPFDDQIERDIKAGKLDDLGQRALAAHKAGRTKLLSHTNRRANV